ncbi:MAG: hypothetical protein ACP6IS_08400 [Candidatus Asgardarchaeia archaeon]
MVYSEDSFKEYARITSRASKFVRLVVLFAVLVIGYYYLEEIHVVHVPLYMDLYIWIGILAIIPVFLILAFIGFGGSSIGEWYKYFSRFLNMDNVATKMNYRSIILKFDDLFILGDTSDKLIFLHFTNKDETKEIKKEAKSISNLFKISKIFCEKIHSSSIQDPKLKIKLCRGSANVYDPSRSTWVYGHAEMIFIENAKHVLFPIKKDDKRFYNLLNFVFDTFSISKLNMKNLVK